ncbi:MULTISPECIES: hypothetical protein [Cobetia]|uniref:DoxX family protein n=1 Tax=Cobetia crustatorum TaxID=553385 RepID=A0A558HUG4_9GAMM|nr:MULTISPECIES: hypothetical protein [Cobetia]TVU72746.1 hypothetical protein FQP86_03485 [Cobetia crustatorum]
MNQYASRIRLSLLLLRLGVFLVMTMWTLDKFIDPGHAVGIFEKFYSVAGVGHSIVYVLAAIEMVLLVLFLAGVKKTITYGLVLILHAGSTLSAFSLYFTPWDNLLFFAAWPMLAACVALFMLRDIDTCYTLGGKQARLAEETALAK